MVPERLISHSLRKCEVDGIRASDNWLNEAHSHDERQTNVADVVGSELGAAYSRSEFIRDGERVEKP